jgi:coenzyme F420-0:L-glutamate ligase
MIVSPLKSHIVQPNADLFSTVWQILCANKKTPRNGDILVISSKIVSFCQGNLVKIESENAFKKLVRKESDHFFGGKVPLTLKNGMLIPYAGIDRSNVPEGYAILWPSDVAKVAKKLRSEIMKRYKLKDLGVLIIDSHCQPLRWGVTGIALAFSGFKGVEDLRGDKDLFGRKLGITRKAVADQLASAASMVMGEGDDAIPMALIQKAPVTFVQRDQSQKALLVKPEECLYQKLYYKVL